MSGIHDSTRAVLAPLRKQLRVAWIEFGAAAAEVLDSKGEKDSSADLAIAVSAGSGGQWTKSQVNVLVGPAYA